MIMDNILQKETAKLIGSWAKYDQGWLRDYLIDSVENPQINVQSILTRHFLLEVLYPGQFAGLKKEEILFSSVMNWFLGLIKKADGSDQIQLAQGELLDGPDGGVPGLVPSYVAEAFEKNPAEIDGVEVEEYFGGILCWSPPKDGEQLIAESVLRTFRDIWRKVLAGKSSERVSVLEPACGSANDYRFIDAYGIGRFLDYTGFDLCKKNIINACRMFPDVRFHVGNVFEINEPEKSCDYCFVHDLFEHLSLEAMEVEIREICRVTKKKILVHFFNMHDMAEHKEQPINDYHWNDLSVSKTVKIFEKYAGKIEVIHIDSLLKSSFGGEHYNKGAYTFVVTL